ncbi:MAG: lactate utilization protein C [Myxococcales bacterium]
MAARDEILAKLRAAAAPAVELPDLSRFAPVTYPDLRERFAKSVIEVGGRCVFVAGSLQDELAKIPEFANARRTVSLVPGVEGNVDLTAVTDPHELNDVDFCVVPAEFGVAENGACWITDHGRANRAVCFLTQHLAIVVRDLVHNLHQAYERIQMPGRGFAMFLSGPSKTADIEQALVIGAHGARSCTVLVTS